MFGWIYLFSTTLLSCDWLTSLMDGRNCFLLEFTSSKNLASGHTFEHLQWDSILLMPAGSGCSAIFIKTCVPRVISSWLWCIIHVVLLISRTPSWREQVRRNSFDFLGYFQSQFRISHLLVTIYQAGKSITDNAAVFGWLQPVAYAPLDWYPEDPSDLQIVNRSQSPLHDDSLVLCALFPQHLLQPLTILVVFAGPCSSVSMSVLRSLKLAMALWMCSHKC